MIIDKIRDEKEFKELFDNRPMDDGLFNYEFIINNPHLYCFYDEKDGKLKGYANMYMDEDNRLFLSGAGVRKNMQENIDAIKALCNSFDIDIYADTDKKEAKICLLKAGFKMIDNDLYKRCKQYG